VLIEFDEKFNWTTAELPDVRIATSMASWFPIGAFARVERIAGSLAINQLGQLPAVTLVVQTFRPASRSATRWRASTS